MRGLGYLLLVALLMSKRKLSGLESASLTWPVRVDGQPGRGGSRITQEFRGGETTRKDGRVLKAHLGVDISVDGHYRDAEGDVLAVAGGRVARAVRGPRGWYVLIDSDDWAHSYLHMSSIEPRLREVGATVAAGDVIGRLGADPLDTYGKVVHLHLQFAPHGSVVDPAPYLRNAADPPPVEA